MTSAQVLLTFFDMSARTHYLNARQTLDTLLEWRVLPVINENDTTATDEISFGDNDFLAAQVAVLVAADELVLLTDIDGLYTRRPAPVPRRARSSTRSSDFAALEELEIGHTHLAAGLGRDALEGGRRRHGHRRGDRDGDLQRPARRGAARPCSRASARARASPPARRATAVQAVAEVRQALARHALIDAGAARAVREGSASLLPVGIVEVRGEFDAGDAVEIAERGATAARGADARRRASATTPRRSCGR